VSPTNAPDVAKALTRLGKPCELKTFCGEQNVLTGRAAE